MHLPLLTLRRISNMSFANLMAAFSPPSLNQSHEDTFNVWALYDGSIVLRMPVCIVNRADESVEKGERHD